MGKKYTPPADGFSIFGLEIKFYGLIMAFAMLIGVLLACKLAKKRGIKSDDIYLLALIVLPCAIVGARLYYCFFYEYNYSFWELFNIKQGGLAIYGAIITAIITAWVYGRVKKISFGQIADTACLGLVLGQAIGRWGNFFNREAFGQYTNGLFAMQLPVSAVRSGEITEDMWANAVVIEGVKYVQVHPTFLYESL